MSYGDITITCENCFMDHTEMPKLFTKISLKGVVSDIIINKTHKMRAQHMAAI